MHEAKLGDPANDVIVEGDALALDELHDGDGRERLCDRSPVKERSGVDTLVEIAIGQAPVDPNDDGTRAHEYGARADNSIPRSFLVEEPGEVRPTCRR